MIIGLGLALGLLVGWAAGGSLRNLATARVPGEAILLAALLAQSIVPRILQSISAPDALLYVLWVSTFLGVIAVTSANAASPGFAAISLGAAANLAAIVVNAGMPVSAVAMRAAGWTGSTSSPPALLEGVTHHLLAGGDKLVVLADVMALPGPAGLQAAVSVGDVLLVVGVVVYLVASMSGSAAVYRTAGAVRP